MFDYLLNSGICLLVFYTFYKLFLEQENMHVYKRIYLLGIVIVSFTIPKITYTTYIEVAPKLVSEVVTNVLPIQPVNEVAEQQNVLPILLGIIYVLGLVIFGLRFLKNFTIIYLKINRNQKIKNENSTSVLLIEDIVPHTFLNFIFFNKQKYLAKNIPTEVIVHEETHSKQKHTLDVLFIEILKVVFWFNPIFYFIEKSIKLNHEFLADQAVVNAGFQDTKYQNTLLAYSSHANQFQLANAINYSSIKKRLVIMKKQKSKRKIAVRGILLIPIFAILLLSFSTAIQEPKATPKQIKEYNTLAKEYNEQPQSQKIVKLKEVNRLNYLYKLMSPEQKSNAEQFPDFPPMPPKSYEIGLKRVTKHFYEYKDVSGKDVKVELQYDGYKDFYNTPPPPPIPKNATEKEKLEYARVIQKYMEDIAKQKQLLDKLATTSKSNDSIYIDKNEWINNAKEIYFNDKLITKIKAKSIIKNDELNLLFGDSVLKISSEPIGSLPKKVRKGVYDTDSNNPPMPPKSDEVRVYYKGGDREYWLDQDFPPGAAYILNNKSVPYKDILKLDKSSIQSVDIVDTDSKGNKFSKQGYVIYTKVIKRLYNDNFILINGKTTCKGCVIQLTKEELAGVNVSVQKGNIIDFKIKFPGKPTLSIANSNTLNKQAKNFLEDLKIGDEVIIFNLKSSESELVSPHFSIKII